MEEYIPVETPKNYQKQIKQNLAIGFQKVDELKLSSYFEKIMDENIMVIW